MYWNLRFEQLKASLGRLTLTWDVLKYEYNVSKISGYAD